MRKIGNITEGEQVVGSRHRVKVVKNKVAPPFRFSEFDIMNDAGISYSGSLIDVGLELGVIEKSGSFLRFKGEVLAQGREAAKQMLEENHKLAKEIEAEIFKAVERKRTETPKRGRPPKEELPS